MRYDNMGNAFSDFGFLAMLANYKSKCADKHLAMLCKKNVRYWRTEV